tara:strand:- start:169 stop:882 length:714 start_codon:yes stop_codon:yes gene_type:complete
MNLRLISIISLIFYSHSFSQNYELSVLGIKIAQAEQNITNGKVKYLVKSESILNLFYPIKNKYVTSYDSTDYSITSFNKVISENDFSADLEAKIDSAKNFIYDGKHIINLPDKTKNIFLLLTMAQKEPYQNIDTKWFNYEHEGNIGKARFVWADSSNVWNGRDSVLCDHYRLDIKLNKPSKDLYKETDYFMRNIFTDNVTRELWISKSRPKQIILASFKNSLFPFPLLAKLKESSKR